MKKRILMTFALLGALAPAVQALSYDQNVTPGVIFGDGNANGSFAVDQANGIELGLRAKLRFDTSGNAQNTYNSNGNGKYVFDRGVAPTKSSPVAVWCFEWSINSNFDGSGGHLNDYTYKLEIDSDPSLGTNFSVFFDPINNLPPAGYWDHSIGTNLTTSASDVIATTPANYATYIGSNNVAQNSWQPHWFLASFDPTVHGTYDFRLTAYDSTGTTQLASTSMQVQAPDTGMTLSLLGLAVAGLGALRRKFRG